MQKRLSRGVPQNCVLPLTRISSFSIQAMHKRTIVAVSALSFTSGKSTQEQEYEKVLHHRHFTRCPFVAEGVNVELRRGITVRMHPE